MSPFRFIPVALVLGATSLMIGCTTSSAMPMGSASTHTMSGTGHMASMDAQTQTMRDMHQKMMAAKTPEDRKALMADHMKAMQGGMTMMGGMSGAGKGDMKAMPGMTGDMAAHHSMMAKHMEMMHAMLQLMMDRVESMPAH